MAREYSIQRERQNKILPTVSFLSVLDSNPTVDANITGQAFENLSKSYDEGLAIEEAGTQALGKVPHNTHEYYKLAEVDKQYKNDIQSLVKRYDNKWESKEFQREAKQLNAKYAADPRLNDLITSKQHADEWLKLKASGKYSDVYDANPYMTLDKDGNPVYKENFRMQIWERGDRVGVAKNIVSDITADIVQKFYRPDGTVKPFTEIEDDLKDEYSLYIKKEIKGIDLSKPKLVKQASMALENYLQTNEGKVHLRELRDDISKQYPDLTDEQLDKEAKKGVAKFMSNQIGFKEFTSEQSEVVVNAVKAEAEGDGNNGNGGGGTYYNAGGAHIVSVEHTEQTPKILPKAFIKDPVNGKAYENYKEFEKSAKDLQTKYYVQENGKLGGFIWTKAYSDALDMDANKFMSMVVGEGKVFSTKEEAAKILTSSFDPEKGYMSIKQINEKTLGTARYNKLIETVAASNSITLGEAETIFKNANDTISTWNQKLSINTYIVDKATDAYEAEPMTKFVKMYEFQGALYESQQQEFKNLPLTDQTRDLILSNSNFKQYKNDKNFLDKAKNFKTVGDLFNYLSNNRNKEVELINFNNQNLIGQASTLASSTSSSLEPKNFIPTSINSIMKGISENYMKGVLNNKYEQIYQHEINDGGFSHKVLKYADRSLEGKDKGSQSEFAFKTLKEHYAPKKEGNTYVDKTGFSNNIQISLASDANKFIDNGMTGGIVPKNEGIDVRGFTKIRGHYFLYGNVQVGGQYSEPVIIYNPDFESKLRNDLRENSEFKAQVMEDLHYQNYNAKKNYFYLESNEIEDQNFEFDYKLIRPTNSEYISAEVDIPVDAKQILERFEYKQVRELVPNKPNSRKFYFDNYSNMFELEDELKQIRQGVRGSFVSALEITNDSGKPIFVKGEYAKRNNNSVDVSPKLVPQLKELGNISGISGLAITDAQAVSGHPQNTHVDGNAIDIENDDAGNKLYAFFKTEAGLNYIRKNNLQVLYHDGHYHIQYGVRPETVERTIKTLTNKNA